MVGEGLTASSTAEKVITGLMPPRRSRHDRAQAFQFGLFLTVCNVVMGASQPVLTRYGAIRLDPLLFCAGATAVAAACSLCLIYARGELRLLVDRRYAPQLFAMSMAGTVATGLTLIYGLRHINAVAGVILLQCEPIYSLILATAVIGERPQGRQVLATMTILVGVGSVFATTNVFSPLFAALLVLVTPFFWQTAHVIGVRLMPPLTPSCLTGGRFVFASLVFTPLFFMFGRDSLVQLRDPILLATVGLTGFFVYFLSALTWYGAIRRLSLSWTTAVVVPGVPMLSILFAILFLGERVTLREVTGLLTAIAGILLLVLGAKPLRHVQAASAPA